MTLSRSNHEEPGATKESEPCALLLVPPRPPTKGIHTLGAGQLLQAAGAGASGTCSCPVTAVALKSCPSRACDKATRHKECKICLQGARRALGRSRCYVANLLKKETVKGLPLLTASSKPHPRRQKAVPSATFHLLRGQQPRVPWYGWQCFLSVTSSSMAATPVLAGTISCDDNSALPPFN